MAAGAATAIDGNPGGNLAPRRRLLRQAGSVATEPALPDTGGAMRKSRWVLVGLVLAGVILAEAVAAETAPAPQQGQATTQRQRAPGVPMTPNPGEVGKREPTGERAEVLRERRRLARGRSGPPEPNRAVPMPRPVPPIIVPTR